MGNQRSAESKISSWLFTTIAFYWKQKCHLNTSTGLELGFRANSRSLNLHNHVYKSVWYKSHELVIKWMGCFIQVWFTYNMTRDLSAHTWQYPRKFIWMTIVHEPRIIFDNYERHIEPWSFLHHLFISTKLRGLHTTSRSEKNQIRCFYHGHTLPVPYGWFLLSFGLAKSFTKNSKAQISVEHVAPFIKSPLDTTSVSTPCDNSVFMRVHLQTVS